MMHAIGELDDPEAMEHVAKRATLGTRKQQLDRFAQERDEERRRAANRGPAVFDANAATRAIREQIYAGLPPIQVED
jgi:hypothetical protein